MIVMEGVVLVMDSKSNLIIGLCELWKTNTQGENGSIVIGGMSEQYRLMENGIIFHDLNLNELQSAGVGLTNTLLLKGNNVFLSHDHSYFWAWTSEILFQKEYTGSEPPTEIDRNIYQLFSACSRAALSSPDFASTDINSRELLIHAQLIFAHLSFPLLEAVLKRACNKYVEYDGNKVIAYKVEKDGSIIIYPNKDKVKNGRESNIANLLHLYYSQIADAKMRENLDFIIGYLEPFKIESKKTSFHVIFSWRNSSLHGEQSYSTVGGTVFNIAILIMLQEIESDYDKLRENYLQHNRTENGSFYKRHNSFYPL